MSFVASNVSQSRLIGKYLCHEDHMHISGLSSVFEKTISRLETLFNDTIDKLLSMDEFQYYPYVVTQYKLRICTLANMRKYICDKCRLIISQHKQKLIIHSLNHLEQAQQNISLQDDTNQMIDSYINVANDDEIEKLRANLVKVHAQIKANYQNTCIQLIMTLMKKLQHNLFLELYNIVDDSPELDKLFYENSNIQKQRNISKQYSDKIIKILSEIKKM
jgi:hypothetical protein